MGTLVLSTRKKLVHPCSRMWNGLSCKISGQCQWQSSHMFLKLTIFWPCHWLQSGFLFHWWSFWTWFPKTNSCFKGWSQCELKVSQWNYKIKRKVCLSRLINIGSWNLHDVHGALKFVAESFGWNFKKLVNRATIYLRI